MSNRPVFAACPTVRSQDPPRRQNGEWLGSKSVWKQRPSNAVPLSTASTAASSPRVRATQSPPPGFREPSRTAGIEDAFTESCQPSPSLIKRLFAHAHARKRAGNHNLVSTTEPSAKGGTKLILRLSSRYSGSSSKDSIDRWGVPEDLYNGLLSQAANVKKLSGQHRLERRRIGLSGEVAPILVMTSSSSSCLNRIIVNTPPTCTVSLFSPDPSLF